MVALGAVAPMLRGELPAHSQMLVAALGNPPSLRLFVAKVTRSPLASRDGKAGYQIECDLVGKLSQAYEPGLRIVLIRGAERL